MMNTVTSTYEDKNGNNNLEHPGITLSSSRQAKGYSLEYIASQLHLTVRTVELIERGEFDLLPGVVFARGYIRSYAKILSIPADPLIAIFDAQSVTEKKTPGAVWHNKKHHDKSEHMIRGITLLFGVIVLIAIVFWWYKNKESQAEVAQELPINGPQTPELKLTDLSKMHLLLAPKMQMSLVRKPGG